MAPSIALRRATVVKKPSNAGGEQLTAGITQRADRHTQRACAVAIAAGPRCWRRRRAVSAPTAFARVVFTSGGGHAPCLGRMMRRLIHVHYGSQKAPLLF